MNDVHMSGVYSEHEFVNRYGIFYFGGFTGMIVDMPIGMVASCIERQTRTPVVLHGFDHDADRYYSDLPRNDKEFLDRYPGITIEKGLSVIRITKEKQ